MGEKAEEKNKKTILKLVGRISIYEAVNVKEQLMLSLKDTEILEMETTEVTECDTSGIQLLCSAKKTADSEGKRIVYTMITWAIQEAMDKTGLPQEMIAHNGGEGCQS